MFIFESIQGYHAQLQNGTVSCLDAVEHCLQQIEKNSHLNAYVHVYGEEARLRAVQLDAKLKSGQERGRLFGVITAIKDVIAYKDHPLTAASRILEGFTSVYNATAVSRLLEEDAIIIGSTNCDEFAMGSTNEHSVYGKVLNAIDNERVPGGSSGGAAVALQSDTCMLSIGSDTGGSVRQPADFCGLIGLKPTYGRISRYGLIAYASSFDQIGIFGKSVPDLALALEVIAGPDSFDSTASASSVDNYSAGLEVSAAGPKKFGYFRQALESPALDPEIRSSLESLFERLREEGHQVEPIEFELLDYIVPTYYVLTTAEASSNLSRFDGIRYGFRNVDKNKTLTELYKTTRSVGFGKEVKRRILLGTFVLSAGYYDAYFTRAQQIRQLLIEKTELVFKEFDAILLPTAPTTAFRAGENSEDPVAVYMADIFTVFANLTGIPAISLPLFWHSNGMPFGVQIMTNRFQELYLLNLANQWFSRFANSGTEKP